MKVGADIPTINYDNRFAAIDFHTRRLLMPRDGAIIFGDLDGKLDVLAVACDKCGRAEIAKAFANEVGSSSR